MILVLTTPRTGSSWFCNFLSEQHQYNNLGEFFNVASMSANHQTAKLEYLEDNPNSIIKCFPYHLNSSYKQFQTAAFVEKSIFKLADKIYILIRRNFHAQCKSLYVCAVTGYWGSNPQPQRKIPLNRDLFEECTVFLKNNYQNLAEYNKKFNCELVCYEDMLTDENRYHNPVIWLDQPDYVEFDVEALFV